MSTQKYFWKVWLRPNRLTKDVDNDYIAEVSTNNKTLRNADIAQRIVKGRSELRSETIESILSERDQIVLEALQEGTAVQDGCSHISPRVLGAWIGAEHKFDAKVNRMSLDMTPSAEMREALSYVGVEVLGVKDSGAYIGLVTDLSTGATDNTITANEDIQIDGDKIKIAPEDTAGLGIFFVDEDGMETPVTHRLAMNTPKRIIARVPALEGEKYTLIIRTQFTKGYALLNDPRTITYEFPLTLER
jgi:hypothetical protein